jgi:hypothetical protein
MRSIVLFLALLFCGCSPYFTGVGHDLTAGAMQEATSTASKKALTELTVSAMQGARNEALGTTTQADLKALTSGLGDDIRAQLNGLITAELTTQLRQLIRTLIDEALGVTTLQEVGALREELVGTALQQDIDAIITSEVPKLTQSLQHNIKVSLAPIETTADNDLAKWKPIAIGFAIGSGLLLICMVIGLVLVLRSHQKVLEAVMRREK